MVRFKNRHLLVEFLLPSFCLPSFPASTSSFVTPSPTVNTLEPEEEEEEDELTLIPPLPFLVSHHDPSTSGLKLGDEGGGVIYRAVRSIIQEVFGDEGWGRVASSFKLVYHSPLTTLTMIRIARQHYRLVLCGVTLLNSINGQPVLPRVVAVSGTIKKLQNKAVAYHRLVTGQMLVAALNRVGSTPELKEEEKVRLEARWGKELEDMEALDD